MSEPRETNSRPLALSIERQPPPQDTTTFTALTAKDKHRKRSSTSSNDTAVETKSASSRSRPGTTRVLTVGSDAGSSRTTQRSTASPNNISAMSTVNYTKTGRVSKAKKGLKVHDCEECGRSYTRAEHLRRHQRNHAQEGAMACRYPNCGKIFYRSDLLQRHEERHNEIGNTSRRTSVASTEHSNHPSPMTVPASLPTIPAITLPPAVTYSQQQILSPQPEVTPFPRYNPSLFRTPQLPRTPKTIPPNLNSFVFQSSPSFKTPPNDSKHRSFAYDSRHSISGPVMVDSISTGNVWHDSFAQSPYSCSSGYASPAPGPEFGQMYATPPYGPSVVRTRASSNASFIEQNWAHASQSPSSSISLPYSWPTDEKNVIVSSFACPPMSYPTTSMPMHASFGAVAHYGPYDPHGVVHMDQEEGAQLFPGEHYGMSQIVRAFPFEQNLNNYWRLFHPTFPIVHRFTFSRLELSPLLYAAMIAINLQYSMNVGDRSRAQSIHKLCVKLLDQREHMQRTGCDRLCDDQAIFLVEIFALYRAQRCARNSSPRFKRMYKKMVGMPAFHPSAVQRLHQLVPTSEDDSDVRWTQWVKLTARQHLLLSCFVLDFQQYSQLGRELEANLALDSANLPFPTHTSSWDATNPHDWTIASQQQVDAPTTILEAIDARILKRYNIFQSAVLVAYHYGSATSKTTPVNTSIEHLLDDSATTQFQLSTAKLTQLVPTRSLLAVLGESWVLGLKTSQEEFSTLRITLQSWISQLWPYAASGYPQPPVEALRISIAMLRQLLPTSEPLVQGIGSEMGLFLAALMVCAATAAASSRFVVSTFSTQPNHLRQARSSISSDRRPSIPHSEILSTASHFLTTAINDILSFNLPACHVGCRSLLLWVKMYFRGVTLNKHSSKVDASNSMGDFRGENISEAITQIERMLDHAWDAWGI